MSDIDLAEAVEAAARARWNRAPMSAQHSWEAMPEAFRVRIRGTVAAADITAALSNIERQVREQVAQEIEAEAARRRRDADEYAAARGGTRDPHQDSIRAGFSLAARIARGDHS